MISKKKSDAPSPEFRQLQKHYGLQSPRQIKERIIWKHVSEITTAIFGPRKENIKRMANFQNHFRTAEKEEARRFK